MTDRSQIETITGTIPDERQKHARHYGVHPYFTRRSASVVQAYLTRYTQEGDVVLDPFGGSGVTAIEALLCGRKAIHNDLNPFANFLTSCIGDTTLVSTAPLKDAFARIEFACKDVLDAIEKGTPSEAEGQLRHARLPKNIRLPRSSDAESFYDLFTPRQLLALATLKKSIDLEEDVSVRNHLLLAWSATAAKLNKTFISAKGRAESRGGSSIFSIYRYKIAKVPVELPLWDTFRGRFLNVLAAKDEIFELRDLYNSHPDRSFRIDSAKNLTVLDKDAADLARDLGRESVDYIFTDPPYGAHIAYLDLSVLWNHWLGYNVSRQKRKEEVIVGGEMGLSEEHYKRQLAASIHDCIAVLKPDRWFSIVFQHWDIGYFQTILHSATACGTELKAAVTQEREVIWSMHKKKNSESMLAGEMILTFYKPADIERASCVREPHPTVFPGMLDAVLRTEVGAGNEITSQYLFNKVILHAWRTNSLDELSVTKQQFVEALKERGWQYDSRKHVWRKGPAHNEPSLWDQTPSSSEPVL